MKKLLALAVTAAAVVWFKRSGRATKLAATAVYPQPPVDPQDPRNPQL